jgi:hypothetical protein
MIVILLPATAGLAALTASLLRGYLRATAPAAPGGLVIEMTTIRRMRRLS